MDRVVRADRRGDLPDYDYLMNRNGTVKRYGTGPTDYQTDVIADDAVDFIERRAPRRAPFFLTVAPVAPHREFTAGTATRPDRARARATRAATRRAAPAAALVQRGRRRATSRARSGTCRSLSAPRRSTRSHAPTGTRPRRCSRWTRWSSASAARSQASGELENTVIVFTSDNGFFHGEHRIPKGKSKVYEEAVRVPLLVARTRLPGPDRDRPGHQRRSRADVRRARRRDRSPGHGRPVPPPPRLAARPLLFEADNVAAPFTAVRTGRWLWVEYSSGGRELYDMVNDRYQLQSRHADPALADARTLLGRLLARLRTCKGAAACR